MKKIYVIDQRSASRAQSRGVECDQPETLEEASVQVTKKGLERDIALDWLRRRVYTDEIAFRIYTAEMLHDIRNQGARFELGRVETVPNGRDAGGGFPIPDKRY